jgi:hypothetical protein
MTLKPGRPFFCRASILLKNLCTPMSIAWTFSSSCIINPLLVRTLFISRMVYVLSSILNSSNSSLVFAFRNLMISVASAGISPNSPLIFSITCLLLCTSSLCSNMICITVHISLIDLVMSIQTCSLTSESVLSATVFFLSYCNSCLSLSDIFSPWSSWLGKKT